MITKKKDPRGGPGRGGGRPKGATGTAGVTVTLRLTPEARAILATHERPGRWLSALIESAPARPTDDGQDAGPVVDPDDA